MDSSFEALAGHIGHHIRLRSTKIDGSPHFAWSCRLIEASPPRLVLHQAAGTPIQTWKQVWTPDFDAKVYFWSDKWFNAIQSLNADGSLRGFYCNVITPARWLDGELRWVDLDLDISVQVDGTYRILDDDEWARNTERMSYAPEMVAHARRAVDELAASIERRAFFSMFDD